MSPRSRHPRNRGLPPGLRVRDGYYSYTSPIDGREKGLGHDKAKAIRWANGANAAAAARLGEVSPADWIAGRSAKNWGVWLDRYAELIAERKLSVATMGGYSSIMRRARAQWPESLAIGSIDTAMIADAVRAVAKDEGKARMSQMYRGWLKDCFQWAIAEGWRSDNPVSVTRGKVVAPNRARLTMEHFQALYSDAAIEPWLRNAMALGLISGQRREDIAGARRRDVHDGCWWVEQHKTGSRVAIPLALRMEVLGMSLGDAIEQCKSSGILSHHLIHRTQRAGAAKPGAPIYLELITRKFTEAVGGLPVQWGERSPPTFHELRSLSKRLYDVQGGVDTMQLLGHKHQQTSDLYGDARGEWVRVVVR